jgi:DNA-binding protein HU-beta
MTEKELYAYMAKKMDSTEKEAQKWFEAFNEGVYQSIEDRESLTIRNFGKFYVRENSRGSVIFKFTPAKKMRNLVGYA